MSLPNEVRIACRVGLKSLRRRVGSAFVIVVGMTCVVSVTLSMLSLASRIGARHRCRR